MAVPCQWQGWKDPWICSLLAQYLMPLQWEYHLPNETAVMSLASPAMPEHTADSSVTWKRKCAAFWVSLLILRRLTAVSQAQSVQGIIRKAA